MNISVRKMGSVLFAAALLLLSLSAPAGETEKKEAVRMVEMAAGFLGKRGREATLAELSRPNGQFVKGQLYVFAYDLTGTNLAHPKNPKLIGKNLYDLPDADGKFFRREIIDTAKTKGQGWSDYKFKNPETGQIEAKTTYFKRVGDLVLCAGVYR